MMKNNLLLFVGIVILSLLDLSIGKPDENQLKEFEKWAKDGNSLLSEKITIKTDTSYEQLRPGVKAVDHIAEGETIAEFTLDNIIHSHTLEYHDIGELVPKLHAKFGDNQRYDPAYLEALALFLIYEKFQNPQSPYKAWLDVLPQIDEMDNILFWKANEIRYLEGSPLMQRAIDRRKEAKDRWDFIKNNLILPYDRIWTKPISEDMYKWAMSIVRSRVVQVIVKSGTLDIYEPGIVPYFDQFHHKPATTQSASWEFDMMSRTLSLRSDAEYKSGDEILVSYGEKCNSELLDFHGYIIPQNPNDCVHIDLELSKTDPNFNEKNIIYHARAPVSSHLKFLRNGITLELLRGAKAATLTQEMITNQMLLRGVPDESLGLKSDFLIADYLLDRARVAFSKYPQNKNVGKEDQNQENNQNAEKKEDEVPPTSTTPTTPEETESLRKQLADELIRGENEILKVIGNHYYQQVDVLARQLMAEDEELAAEFKKVAKEEL